MKRATPKTRAAIDQLEEVFKALADKTRLRILALLGNNEVCVCHIHDSLGLPQPTVSRHLAYLRRSGLVAARRDGVWMHYQVSKSLDPVVQGVVKAAVEALGQLPATARIASSFSARSGNSTSWIAPRAARAARRGLRSDDEIEAATDRDLPRSAAFSSGSTCRSMVSTITSGRCSWPETATGGGNGGTGAVCGCRPPAVGRSRSRQQGRHIGHQLTEAALRLARTHGVEAVYLLTTTAERFFPKFGFEQIAREEVPAAVRSSVEFASACPASAIVMRKRLTGSSEADLEGLLG